MGNNEASQAQRLKEVAFSTFKLGCIGFGGIAGMVATIENEMVVKRKWIDHQHFMDVLATSYIIPGPNAVEVIMHCGKERAGRLGLIVAGARKSNRLRIFLDGLSAASVSIIAVVGLHLAVSAGKTGEPRSSWAPAWLLLLRGKS
ncbi:chromate transporter [Chitinophaga parva]|uniref:chromate transporter n=1 Tax=Chitinophaga parva TaxID=2169414 RepID=UPI001F0C40EA|nr:chromate transporter [Chitinophaga parva]